MIITDDIVIVSLYIQCHNSLCMYEGKGESGGVRLALSTEVSVTMNVQCELQFEEIQVNYN